MSFLETFCPKRLKRPPNNESKEISESEYMKVCYTKTELTQEIARLRSETPALEGTTPTLGFVPTMGALHQGHLSLLWRARRENDIAVASIFVNPIQFNNPNDLKTYPRDLEADLKLLEPLELDLVFAPSAEEMYPAGAPIEHYDFGALEQVMEGKKRPGHFNGVGVVVGRLFKLIAPDKAYFGEKDYQQIAIIRELVRQLQLKVQIVSCPIVREEDGLALSSRNLLLTSENRALAPNIYRILKESVAFAQSGATVLEVRTLVETEVGHVPGMELEYFEMVDGESLQPVTRWEGAAAVMGCIVVLLGGVRLIDNIRYR